MTTAHQALHREDENWDIFQLSSQLTSFYFRKYAK